jgi:hypothetical protein
MSDRTRQILIVLAVLAVIIVNGLANALPINGLDTGQISDSFDVYFVPAGYVFSIWGLIYLGLIGFAIFQALPAQRQNPRLRGIGGPFLLSSLANISWIFLWHYLQFPLTLIAMLVLLATLIVIYLRLRQGTATPERAERWLVRLPFSIYLGWVSVATIANFTSVLSFYEWGGLGIAEPVWAVIMLVVGFVLATIMTLRQADAAYNLVFVWAYAGIGVAQADTPLVATVAYIGAGLIGLLAIGALVRQLQQTRPTTA